MLLRQPCLLQPTYGIFLLQNRHCGAAAGARVFYGTVQPRRAIKKKKHGTSLFDVSYLNTKLQEPAANLRPPRKCSCITKENIQVGMKRRPSCKKTPKCKVRTARRLLVPKRGRKAYARVQFISGVCACARKTTARTCPCMHICHTQTVCSHK